MEPDSTRVFFLILQQSLGGLTVLGASIYYLLKKKNTAGILMVLGMLATETFSILSRLNMFKPGTGLGDHFAKVKIYSALTYFSYFIFVAGFVMLIIGVLKKDRQSYQLLDETISENNDDL